LRIEETSPLTNGSRMSAAFDVQHETVLCSGRVQGVGFRYTALQLAREFEIAGYVQNLPDGRVRIEVEGNAQEVNDFIGAIEERMHGYVRKVERTSARRAPQFVGFTVR
jgi:acylphosphatase